MATIDLQAEAAKFPFWYHKIELPGGFVTPGWAPLDPDSYSGPQDLTGKRVLDVRARDGYWTFEALKRGASEVVAIDDFSDYLGTLEEKDRRAWETFDFCRESLGYSEDRCKRIEMSVYEATEDRIGRFDVVFCFGTLYHLRYPLLALDVLASVCDERMFIESAILDDFSPYRGGFGHGYSGAQPVMEFYPTSEYGNNPTNWWVPSLACLGMMTIAIGFDDCQVWKLTDQPQHLAHCRGFAHAWRNAA